MDIRLDSVHSRAVVRENAADKCHAVIDKRDEVAVPEIKLVERADEPQQIRLDR